MCIYYIYIHTYNVPVTQIQGRLLRCFARALCVYNHARHPRLEKLLCPVLVLSRFW